MNLRGCAAEELDRCTVQIEYPVAVTVRQEPVAVLALARFPRPEALTRAGGGRYQPTESSGPAGLGRPGHDGFGRLRGGALAGSNVDAAEAMMHLPRGQRFYALNARAFQSAAELQRLAANLRA